MNPPTGGGRPQITNNAEVAKLADLPAGRQAHWKYYVLHRLKNALLAKLADAQASGVSGGNPIGVQISSSAH